MNVLELNKTHIMVDLETLDTGPYSTIVSIGATEMELDQYGIAYPGDGDFHVRIDITSPMPGFGLDAKTVLFWLAQPDEARSHLFDYKREFGMQGTMIIQDALNAFAWWVEEKLNVSDKKNARIWGNGAGFDNVILRNAYKLCGMENSIPWLYSGDRCYRTVRNMFPEEEATQPVVRHNALHDAQAQAATLRRLHNISRETVL